jgi:Zn-dependent alcohol dehydrogenase
MRAAVCRAFGQPLEIEEVTLAPPGPGQIEVRLAACAICHSDIAYATGAWGGVLPAVYGHEAAGHVAALGPGVAEFALGDPVLVTLIRSCGACPACARSAPTSCTHGWDPQASPLRDAAGRTLLQGMNTGAFAEAVVVDAGQCAALPPDFDLSLASLLSCGVLTGVGSVLNAARAQPGDSVAVVGVGGVGLNAVQGAAIAGAAPIIAVDVDPGKLAAARVFGATHGVAAGPDAAAEVHAITGGRGVDFAVVTAAAPAAIATAIDLLARGGAAIVVGMPPSGTVVGYDPTALAALNQSIIGSRMGRSVLRRDVPALIEHHRAGRLKLAELVAGRFPLDRINEAFAATIAGAAGRNIVVFEPALA